MDVYVDIKVLEHEKDFLQKEIQHLTAIKERITHSRDNASADLEGDQFEMASSEVDNVSVSIDESISHLEDLIQDIDEMLEHLRAYADCKYEG